MRAPQLAATAVIRREMLTTLRAWPAFACLLLFTGAAALAVLLAWPPDSTSQRDAASASSDILASASFVLLAGSLLFVTLFASTAIVSEKERDTYDQLFLTLVTPGGLVAAKLLNALSLFLLLVVSALPVLAATFFLIGLDVYQVSQALLVLTITAVNAGLVGLMFSAWCRRTFTAVAGSYLGICMFATGFSVVLIAPLKFLFGANVMRMAPPQFQLLALIFSGQSSWGAILVLAVRQGVIGLICLALTTAALRRPPRMAKVDAHRPIDDPEVLRERAKRFPYYLIDPLRRKPPIEDGRNPMRVREMRWGFFGRTTRMVRAFYQVFILLFVLGIVLGAGARWYSVWMQCQMVLVLVLVPALLGNTLTKEYEYGNIDLLRLTLLDPAGIVQGKFLAGVLALTPLLGAAVLGAVPITIVAYAYGDSLDPLVYGYPTLFVSAFLALSVSLFYSVVTRRTGTAMALTYATTAGLFYGGLLVRWLVSALPERSLAVLYAIVPRQLFAQLYSGFSPVVTVYYQSASRPWVRRYGGAGGAFAGQPYDVVLTGSAGRVQWMVGLVLFLVLGWVLFRLSQWVFARYRMQDV